MRSTEKGYVNRNQQRNNGKTQIPGTDNFGCSYVFCCLIPTSLVYFAMSCISQSKMLHNLSIVAILTDWLRFNLVISDGLIPHLLIK